MAKKATGLAAFTRPRAGAEATSLAAIEDDRPVVEIPTPRRKRGGARLSRLRSRSGDRTGSAFASSQMQRARHQAMAEAGLSAVLAQHGLPPIEPYAR